MGQRSGTLPGATQSEGDRIVAHVDADCFYAACERLREPSLEGEPVVVGMGYEPGEGVGAVATASYEARAHGVESAQAISTALDRLPRRGDADPGEPAAYYRPVDMAYYEEVAREVRSILDEVATTVREVSIDEAYLDLTAVTDWEVVAGYARHIKDRVARKVGVTVSVGVAPTMSAAKVASDRDKPDGLVVVEPGEVQAFFADLDVEAVHGVGPVTARRLRDHDIETAGDLAEADIDWLASTFGDRGRELGRRARGIDPREVEPRDRPKSFSRESAFPELTSEYDQIRDRIQTLAAAVADRARRRGVLYRTIGVKVVEPPFDINTRERSLPGPVDDPELLESVALELLSEFEGVDVRKVGVRVANLSFTDADQSDLGTWTAPDADADRRWETEYGGQTSLGEFDDGNIH
ncbi:MAG: DNA polymerase IV [Halodesulfurarchaeum sp.]